MPTSYGMNPGQVMPGTGFGNPSTGGYDPTTLPQYSAPAQNLQNFGYIAGLTSLMNSLNQQGQAAALAQRIPNEPGLETQSSALIGSELQGKLPKDVMDLLAQQGAERGVATGSPGSPNSSAAYLRALGLSSLQEQQQGEQNLTAAEGRNPPAPLFNPSSELVPGSQGGGGGGASPGGRVTLPPMGYSAPAPAGPPPPMVGEFQPTPGLDYGPSPTPSASSSYVDSQGNQWTQDPASGSWINTATGEQSATPPDLGYPGQTPYDQTPLVPSDTLQSDFLNYA